ncbi:hypothetical protein [Microvirga lotononidis]|uniref:Uncharacterized protein n=1 Tax=Microvirga lotononidis TaxID=864069 RepID=I4YP63_9HYPH|nr:hypothetical protein [Microvirga lotononidis]EIM25755.1 hypothetical protein MicloDRAFT_00064820 [Microvirga lotononidis]WQO25684.1 hypothetical protein U0023_13250 [Microvirga lotononidis]
MATLTIGDKKVTVDDSFLSLSPEEQNATVEEIASSIGVKGAEQTAPTEDNRPWYKKAGEAADDIVRIAADGLTFGYADKLAGYLGGEGTDAERAKTQAARDRAGSAGLATDIGATIVPGVGLAKAGITAARVVPGVAAKGAKGLAARSAAMAADGAALGALSATGHDTDVGDGALYGAIGGAVGNVAGEGIAKAVGKAAGAFSAAPKIATSQELKEAAEAAYQKADDAGIVIAPKGLETLKGKVETQLAERGYLPALHPRIGAALQELDRIQGQPITLKGMDLFRRVASNAASSADASERAIAKKIIGEIDGFVGDLGYGDVVMGDVREGVKALKEARELWTRIKKTEMVDDLKAKAQRRADSTGSGGNVDNAIRQNLRRILDDPKKARGFTKDERLALEAIVRGSTAQNIARLIGKLSPQGNGLMAMLGLGGAAAFGPAALAVSGAGAGAKFLADRATPANVEKLSRIIRAGGDASATRAAPNALQVLADSERETIARALSYYLATAPISARAKEPE